MRRSWSNARDGQAHVRLALAWLLPLMAACDAAAAPQHAPPAQDAAVDAAPAAVDRPSFCDRNQDAVRDLFCEGTRPEVTSLAELQALLNSQPGGPSAEELSNGSENVYYRLPVLLGHSTALSGHLVSPLNPRAFVVGPGIALAFQRGVQRVELASISRERTSFNFYLVTFRRACGDQTTGCAAVELYTPRVESDWTSYAVQDAEDVKDTPLDCKQCHQRGRDTPTLLMRELQRPWTHFFDPLSNAPPIVGAAAKGLPPEAQASDLLHDYLTAKGDEHYANIDVGALPHSSAFVLQSAVGTDQPLVFDTVKIMQERFPLHDGEFPSEAQPSPTWERAYQAFKRGEQLSLPYLEPRATDPDKQAHLSEAYRKWRDGELGDEDFPDLSDIYPDDPLLRARMGLQTEPGASAPEALIQACGPCHNDVLDQSVSRARFNIDVSRLDPSELDRAIDRIQRERGAAGAMPPPEARQLDDGAVQRVLDYLRGEARSGTPEPLLVHAAQMGMAGNAPTSDASDASDD